MQKSGNTKYQKQVDKSHYEPDQYLNQERWVSYFHQVENVMSIAKNLGRKKIRVLLIGVGDGIVSETLKHIGHDVVTMDIDPDLKPDYEGILPVIDVPIKGKFDCIVCCEVLEHLSYQDAIKSLKSIADKSKYSVISVPHKRIAFTFWFRPPIYKPLKFIISIPSNYLKHKFDGQHYWELGAKDTDLGKFKESIDKSGLNRLNDYQVAEFPRHHFFILKSYKEQ